MVINDIVSLISTCGFPIFACVYLAKTQAKQIEKLSDVIERNTEAIKELSKRK
jgi:hypothetical protein